MSLDPFFSLSPLSPYAYTYDAANPNNPCAFAYLNTYGGYTDLYSLRRLTDQHSDDQILLAYDPVPQSSQTIASFADDFVRRCVVRVAFRGYNVSTVNQYLLVFRLARWTGSPIAQFFIGTDLVRAETLTVSPYDDIAILIDTPGVNVWVTANVRLATAGNYNQGFFFKGVDGYLL
jgi:hypothetical protein